MSNVSHNQRWKLPRGQVILALLLALYYSTVILAGVHFKVLQLLVLWGLVLVFLPAYRAPFAQSEITLLLSMTAIFMVATLSYVANGLMDHPDANLSRYARFLFFVPIYMVIRRYATVSGFWYALLCGALVTGVWSVLEFAGWVRHPDDRWGEVSGAVNSIQFGDLSLAMAAMTCAGLPVYRRYGPAFFVAAILAVALGLFACAASSTRGAWIAIPALTVVLGWMHLRTGFLSLRKLYLLALAGILALIVVIPRTDVIPQVQEAVHEVKNYEKGGSAVSDVGYRFELWRASWEIFKAHPLIGVGPGLFRTSALALAAETGGYNSEAIQFSQPLSEYFFVMATLGSLGLIALGLLWLVPLARFVLALYAKDADLQALGLCGAVMIVCYLHFGLTEGLMFQHATFLGFYLLSVAVLATLINGRQRELIMEKSQ